MHQREEPIVNFEFFRVLRNLNLEYANSKMKWGGAGGEKEVAWPAWLQIIKCHEVGGERTALFFFANSYQALSGKQASPKNKFILNFKECYGLVY